MWTVCAPLCLAQTLRLKQDDCIISFKQPSQTTKTNESTRVQVTLHSFSALPSVFNILAFFKAVLQIFNSKYEPYELRDCEVSRYLGVMNFNEQRT